MATAHSMLALQRTCVQAAGMLMMSLVVESQAQSYYRSYPSSYDSYYGQPEETSTMGLVMQGITSLVRLGIFLAATFWCYRKNQEILKNGQAPTCGGVTIICCLCCTCFAMCFQVDIDPMAQQMGPGGGPVVMVGQPIYAQGQPAVVQGQVVQAQVVQAQVVSPAPAAGVVEGNAAKA
eukprot:TRINITY_DN23594_c0_g2_i1.p1 TRINITY_DN23594_c0_g2~~TRINITY_DN23594_c0_g2_i1.p1  ORF type:complete len:178 (+),score=36.13 TRINITY_DN23594_c0_g2_i1:87-620(+)